MIEITTHATKRFVQRVMELDDVGYMSDMQITAIKDSIAKAIKPYIDTMNSVGYGKFNIDGIQYVLKDHAIVTIQLHNNKKESEGYATLKGGATRSGRKIKKMKRLTDDER